MRNPEKLKATRKRFYDRHRERLIQEATDRAKKTREQTTARIMAKRRADPEAEILRRQEERRRAAAKKGKRYLTQEERKLFAIRKQILNTCYVQIIKQKKAKQKEQTKISQSEKWKIKYANDPAFAAKERLRNSIKKKQTKYSWIAYYLGTAAKKQSGYKSLWDALGYTSNELKEHLERQFTNGMSWEKFLAGEIHIDHIIPKSKFDLNTLEDLKACHGLSNLRPLWAKHNLKKSDHVLYLL